MKQNVKLMVLIAAVYFSAPAFSETCDELEELYFHQDKIYSFMPKVSTVDGDEYLAQLKSLTKKQIILQFMDKQSCPYPKVVQKDYSEQAAKCPRSSRYEVLIATRHGEVLKDSPACDMSKW